MEAGFHEFEASMKQFQRRDLSGLMGLVAGDGPLDEGEDNDPDFNLHNERTQNSAAPLRLNIGKTALKNEAIGILTAIPNVNDPNLFALRVKRGCAEDLVKQIVIRCITATNPAMPNYSPEDLGVLTAFTNDKEAEYIYVEALTKRHLTTALAGLQNIYFSRIETVPVDSKRKLLTSCLKKEVLKPRDMVRMRSGLYKGDLAEVLSVEATKVTVRMIPRIDLSDASGARAAASQTQKTPVGAQRIPQKFFSPIGLDNVRSVGSYYDWCGLRFDSDGYLIRTVSRFQTVSGTAMAKVTEMELTKFHKSVAPKPQTLTILTQRRAFNCGDTVKVSKGEYRGAIGEVIETFQARQVVVRSQNGPCITVDRTDLSPYFPLNSNVIVTAGPHQGVKGNVIYIDPRRPVVVLLASDDNEVEVSVDDVEYTSRYIVPAVNKARVAYREYELLKAKPIAGATTDRILFVARSTATELNCLGIDGSVCCILPTDVVSRIQSKKATARDRESNLLRVGDAVTVKTVRTTTATLTGVTATVKQIHLRTLFLHSPVVMKTFGCFIESADHVLKLGAKVDNNGSRSGAIRPPSFAGEN